MTFDKAAVLIDNAEIKSPRGYHGYTLLDAMRQGKKLLIIDSASMHYDELYANFTLVILFDCRHIRYGNAGFFNSPTVMLL